jgi:hypothetical protein
MAATAIPVGKRRMKSRAGHHVLVGRAVGKVTPKAIHLWSQLATMGLQQFAEIVALGAQLLDRRDQKPRDRRCVGIVAVKAGIGYRLVGHLEIPICGGLDVVVTAHTERRLRFGERDSRSFFRDDHVMTVGAIVGDRRVNRASAPNELLVTALTSGRGHIHQARVAFLLGRGTGARGQKKNRNES